MKTCLVSCLTLIFAQASAWAQPIDIVVDLDGVLLYSTDLTHTAGRENPVIEAAGSRYRLSYGAAEFVESLRRIPDARVSFFSTVKEHRNVEVLRQIRLPDGLTAHDIAHQIFSEHHMSQPDGGQPELSIFHGPKKKNLNVLGEGFRPERAILIDDWPIHAAKGQEKGLLLVTPSKPLFDFGVEFIANIPEEAHVGQPEPDWKLEEWRERNKLVRVVGLLHRAIVLSEINGSTVPEALWELQWRDGRYLYHETNSEKVFRSGERFMSLHNDGFKAYFEQPGVECAAYLM